MFAPSFMGAKSSELWSRILDEYQILSKKFKVILIAEENLPEDNKNLSLLKVHKIPFEKLIPLYHMLSVAYFTIMNRKKYDLVFLRLMDHSMVGGIIAKKLFKIKLIIWISTVGTGFSGIQSRIFTFLYKMTLKNADVIVVSSPKIIDDVQAYVGSIKKSKIKIVKYGVNTARFAPKNIPRKKNDILYVGRITKVKGIEDIIKALPIILESIPDVKLKIIGNIIQKNYFTHLQNLAVNLKCESNIEFVGKVPHGLLVEHYNSAKIFVLMSRGEDAQSNVTSEAMACEIPVIVTPIGILGELIKNGENGFLVNSKQSKILAKRIISLLQNESLQTKIGKAGRDTILTKGTIDTFVEGIGKILSKIVLNN